MEGKRSPFGGTLRVLQLEVRLGNFSLFTVKGKREVPSTMAGTNTSMDAEVVSSTSFKWFFPEQHCGLLHEFFDVVGLEGAQCIGGIEGKPPPS